MRTVSLPYADVQIISRGESVKDPTTTSGRLLQGPALIRIDDDGALTVFQGEEPHPFTASGKTHAHTGDALCVCGGRQPFFTHSEALRTDGE